MSDNTRAQFVVDEDKHKEEMEDLYALKKMGAASTDAASDINII